MSKYINLFSLFLPLKSKTTYRLLVYKWFVFSLYSFSYAVPIRTFRLQSVCKVIWSRVSFLLCLQLCSVSHCRNTPCHTDIYLLCMLNSLICILSSPCDCTIYLFYSYFSPFSLFFTYVMHILTLPVFHNSSKISFKPFSFLFIHLFKLCTVLRVTTSHLACE